MGHRYRVLVQCTQYYISPPETQQYLYTICGYVVLKWTVFEAAGIAPIVTKFSLFPGNLRQCGGQGGGAGLEVARTVATSRLYRGGGGGPGSAGQLVLDTAWHSDTSVFSPASSSTVGTRH